MLLFMQDIQQKKSDCGFLWTYSVLVWQTTSFFILSCLVKAHIILLFRDLKAGRCCVNQPILFSAKKQIVTFSLTIPTFISTTGE